MAYQVSNPQDVEEGMSLHGSLRIYRWCDGLDKGRERSMEQSLDIEGRKDYFCGG